MRLLIVDDSADDAELLLHELRRADMHPRFIIVDTLSSFRDALQTQTWDIITSDHSMPAFSAPEALKIARALRPQIPFIVVSGETDPDLAVALIRNGAHDFVQKRHLALLPIAIKEALNKVDEERHRESIEVAMHEREWRMGDMLGNVELISLLLDNEGQILYCNDYFLRVTGWDQTEALGKNWFEHFVPPVIIVEIRDLHARLLADKPGAWHQVDGVLTRAGKRCHIRWTNSVMHSLSGEVIGTTSIGMEITADDGTNRQSKRVAHPKPPPTDALSAVLSECNTVSFNALERLRAQALILAEMEKKIDRLEKTHAELIGARETLTDELQRLQQAKREWEWFFDRSFEMLCMAGTNGYFTRVNKAFEQALGYSSEELTSCPFSKFVHPEDIEKTQSEFLRLSSGEDCIYFENRYRHKNGTWRWITWTCPAPADDAKYLVAIARDVTEQKMTDADLLFRAQHDSLTDLANRAMFDQVLEQAIARTNRNPANQVALFLIDLDGFKDINDCYGHAAGDHLLKVLAGRFSTNERAGDLVCRFGGDEFAWIVEGASPLAIESIAAKITELVRSAIEINGIAIEMRCSIGVSTFPSLTSDARSLLDQADAAMYAMKRNGKNRYSIYVKES